MKFHLRSMLPSFYSVCIIRMRNDGELKSCILINPKEVALLDIYIPSSFEKQMP